MNKAVFIDKDGTLIIDVPHNVNTALIQLYDDALESLESLKENFCFIIISNQPGVALGYFSERELENVKEKIELLLAEKNITLKGFYYCPHAEHNNCDCRKPRAGLILKAASELNINLSESWMLGDILNDVEAGNAAGCKTILINNKNETRWEWSAARIPDFFTSNLKEAAEIILSQT